MCTERCTHGSGGGGRKRAAKHLAGPLPYPRGSRPGPRADEHARKVVGVRRVAHDSIPGAARKNLEDRSWVNGSPDGESPKGQEHAGNAVVPQRMYRKTRVIWLRLDCFKPNLHSGHTFPHWLHQCRIIHWLSPTTGVTFRMRAMANEAIEGDEWET